MLRHDIVLFFHEMITLYGKEESNGKQAPYS